MAAAVRQVMDTLGLGEVQAQILVANCDGNAEAAVMNFLENGARIQTIAIIVLPYFVPLPKAYLHVQN